MTPDWTMRISDYPLLTLVISFGLMTVAAWLGGAIAGRRGPMTSEAREDFNVVQASTLTLLGLIIGFTFSMALNRYDQRKNYEEEEANAIGTAYLRVDLLDGGTAARARAMLKGYAEERIRFYASPDAEGGNRSNAAAAKLQADLWSAVSAAAKAQPNPLTQLAVASINDVVNSQGYTQAAWWNRIPRGAWALMGVLAVCANFMVGFGAKTVRPPYRLLLVLPLVVAVSFFLIADIDAPRRGVIHVAPQNLQALVDSLK
jgi:hypothetical protein